MNVGEEFVQDRIACEVDGCGQTATARVIDVGRLYGQGPFPIELVPIGPVHFLCSLHQRDSYSFERVNGKWVRN